MLRTDVTRASTVHRASAESGVELGHHLAADDRARSYFYLYLVMDVWSRRIVGWSIAESESAELAAALITSVPRRTRRPAGLVLHSDNGKPMRGNTMIATLQWLGIVPSFSRPHVSDDNPYSEALFRTLKHTPAYPRTPFETLEQRARWVTRFVAWYNGEHRHSAIRYVTPDERHYGHEQESWLGARALSTRRRSIPDAGPAPLETGRQCFGTLNPGDPMCRTLIRRQLS